MTLNFERKMRIIMKNFKFTGVSEAADAITLAVVGKMTIEGKNNAKSVMNGEAVSFEVEDTDAYTSIAMVVRAFALIEGLNLITITMPITDNGTVSEHMKNIVTGVCEEEMCWSNVDIGSAYDDKIVFVRNDDTKNKTKTISLELVLPAETHDDFMRDIRSSVHKSLKGMGDYIESNVIVYSSPTGGDDLVNVGVNVDCFAVKDKIGVFGKIERFVSETLEKVFNGEDYLNLLGENR